MLGFELHFLILFFDSSIVISSFIFRLFVEEEFAAFSIAVNAGFISESHYF